MRIIFLFIVVSSLFIIKASAQPPTTYITFFNEAIHPFSLSSGIPDQQLEPELLKSKKVKSIKTWQFLDNGIDVFESSKNFYDTNGRCTKQFIYKINYKTIWIYDSIGNLVEEIDSTDKGIRGHCKYLYIYDSIERLSNRIVLNITNRNGTFTNRNQEPIINDTCITRNINFKWDDSGNLSKIITEYTHTNHSEVVTYEYTYFKDGLLKSSNQFKNYTFEYDRKNRIKKWNETNDKGKIYEITKFKYDRKGNIIEMKSVHEEGIFIEKQVFEYSKLNLPVLLIFYRPMGVWYKRYFEYEFYDE